MLYATLAELKAVIPMSDLQLLTDFEGEEQPSDVRLSRALADASAEIDGYVGGLVRGLPDPPHILTVYARDLAMHRLYLNLGHDMTSRDKVRASIIAYLRQVQAGEASLGDDGTGVRVESTPGVAMTDGPDRVMTRDQLRGY